MYFYEVDLQLLMRIYIEDRNNENIEKDKRSSQFNCRSRRHYLIDTTILEKILMHDAAVSDRNLMTHNSSDLKACYDR